MPVLKTEATVKRAWVRFPHPPPLMKTKCSRLNKFMKTQTDVIHKHLGEHKWLRKIEDDNTALESFINDYGWLIREMYCAHICDERSDCTIADKLKKDGDLLRDHLPKKKKEG